MSEHTLRPFDILLLAGQSNAEGNGKGDASEAMTFGPRAFELRDAHPTHLSEKPDHHYLEITLPTETALAPLSERIIDGVVFASLFRTFVPAYLEAGMLAPGRDLLLVKAAVGGTGFSKLQWGVGEPLSERAVVMIRRALETHPESRVVACLWHQGESDAFEKPEQSDEERYADYVAALEAQLRLFRQTGGGDFPIVCGDFIKDWGKNFRRQLDVVEAATREVCRRVGRAAVVESDGLTSNNEHNGNGDTIHFSLPACDELGRRYFAAYKALRG